VALNVGTLVAELVLNRRDFDKGVDESERRFGGLGSKLGGAAKGIGVAVATGLAVAGTAAASGAVALYGTGVAIDALGKKAATVFGPELGKAQQWAAQNAEAMGLTRSQAVGLAAGFSDLLIPMGFTRQQATQMSTDVVGLSGALSEWSGGQKSAAEVSDILAKAMLGERDGLKALGVSISDADVKARLAAKGQDKLTGAALEQAKALVTQQLIMEKSTDAQAAYAAGADDPIRKQAQLRARTLELKDAFATALLPASNAVVAGLLNMSEGALPKVEARLATTVAGLSEFVAGVTMSKGETAAYGAALDGAASVGNRVGVVIRTVAGAVREFAAGASMSRSETAAYGGALDGAASVGNRFGGVVRSVVEAVRDFMAGLRTSKGEADAYGGALDGMALVGLRVREALTSVFEAIRSGDVGKLKDGFAGAGETAAGLTGGLQSLSGLLPSLGTLIGTAADVVKFLADNSGLLVDALPFLIVGFGLYKTAQALANVAAFASLPILAAQVISNFALAASNNALAAALGLQRTSLLASTLAWIGNTASAVANGVAQLALKAGIILTQGAIYGITAAQWLWNAALTANPIGLVVAAIALLVGGLVLAWRESETFRRIVVGAINGVKDVTLEIVGRLVGAWFWFADKILLAAELAFGWIPGIGDKVTQARQGMASVAGAIQGEIEKLQGKDINLNVKANGSYTMSSARAENEHSGLANRATGGAIHGWGTGTSDSIPALLSDDEHVWTAEEVQKAGGHSRMYALRAAVRSGALGAYATGGAVGVRAAANIGRIVPEQYDPTEKALLSGIATTVGSGIAAAQAAAASAASASSASSAAPGGVAGRGNVDAELLRRFDAWNASMGGSLRIVSGYRSSAKQAQLYASYLAGTGNLAARPGSSNHEKSPARAIDYGPASWSRTPGSYAYGLKAPVRSEPWHLERAFDDGGVARGSGMMPKFNPRPERVLSPGQTEAFERLVQVLDRQGVGAGVSVSVSADAGLAQQYAEQVAERTVVKWRDALAVSGLASIL